MRIAPRITMLFLPLLIVPLAFVSFVAWFGAQDGITAVARSLLAFKLEELTRFAATQHDLLEANGLLDDPAFREAARRSVAEYATGVIRSPTELVFGVDRDGAVPFASGSLSLAEAVRLARAPPQPGWNTLVLDGVERVAAVGRFEPFDWILYVTERVDTFFAPVGRITIGSAVTAGASVVAVLLAAIAMARLITRPLKATVQAMRRVITEGDWSHTVEARLNDETGELADAFNFMLVSLDSAYGEMKSLALDSAFARTRETKIRTVFQRYVPQHVINDFFRAPESMLVGDERELSILMSDIRGFTAFSETLSSGDVVDSLNQYFTRMVEVIESNSGIADKYMGDAIMAFYGAPTHTGTAPRDAVMTAFQMLSELDDFNEWQTGRGRKSFRIGIGVSHGKVTVGNIGSERKMDYTVIGDVVNVVARLEKLTKVYRQPLLVTESVRRHIGTIYPVRMVDRVRVRGRSRGLGIWTAQPAVSAGEERAWKAYHAGLMAYYNREFDQAVKLLRGALELLPGDYLCELFIERAGRLAAKPPPGEWDGLVQFDPT